MASAWQRVLAAHQRIVDNGGMLVIAHNFTELASNFKNLRLQQIFSGCKRNVGRWGGGGGADVFPGVRPQWLLYGLSVDRPCHMLCHQATPVWSDISLKGAVRFLQKCEKWLQTGHSSSAAFCK